MFRFEEVYSSLKPTKSSSDVALVKQTCPVIVTHGSATVIRYFKNSRSAPVIQIKAVIRYLPAPLNRCCKFIFHRSLCLYEITK